MSGQNSEDKTAKTPLVQEPVKQSRDQDSGAHDDSSISIGLGGSTYGNTISSECSLNDDVPLDDVPK